MPSPMQHRSRALNTAIDGVKGTTAVHIYFGYAAVIHGTDTICPGFNIPNPILRSSKVIAATFL
jgi:hypothetical protein